MATKKNAAREEAIRELRKIVKPGMTVFTVLRHVSSSGMSRRISLLIIRKGEPYYLDYNAGRALDYKRHPTKDGLTVGGCGMDMGFHLVYSLSSALFPKGTAKAKDPAAKTNGGYALAHRWL